MRRSVNAEFPARSVSCLASRVRVIDARLRRPGCLVPWWTRVRRRTVAKVNPMVGGAQVNATLDPRAQMGFPRLLPDRTREIADGIGSARRGEQLSV